MPEMNVFLFLFAAILVQTTFNHGIQGIRGVISVYNCVTAKTFSRSVNTTGLVLPTKTMNLVQNSGCSVRPRAFICEHCPSETVLEDSVVYRRIVND